jgi:hypothetical protein
VSVFVPLDKLLIQTKYINHTYSIMFTDRPCADKRHSGGS